VALDHLTSTFRFSQMGGVDDDRVPDMGFHGGLLDATVA
jgi:hypothetical protein